MKLPSCPHSQEDNMEETVTVPHILLHQGPIAPELLAALMLQQSHGTAAGAQANFLGQIRADQKDGKVVKAIDYTAYPDMALLQMNKIREEALERFSLKEVFIIHSQGMVEAGEASMLIWISAGHRKEAFPALQWVVNEVKFTVPLWKREIFTDGSHHWVQGEVPPQGLATPNI